MKEFKATCILVCGDIHREFSISHKMASNIRRMIPGTILIQVGDFGLFNQEKDEPVLENLNALLYEKGVKLLVIRGNHDNPELFKKFSWDRFQNIKFLEDYTYLKINDAVFGFVGGAISIDRLDRSEGLDYWKDEHFFLDSKKSKKCDVLITHTAPPYIGPGRIEGLCVYYCDRDERLPSALTKERIDLETLIKKTKPKKHYCGHFHCSFHGEKHGCVSRILAINEILEIQT